MSTLRIFNNPRDGYVLVAERRRIGRLSEDAVTICDFASKADAVTAASVAFHALREHLAERAGTSLDRADASGDSAEMSVYADGDREDVSFCFELRFPSRLTDLGAVRAARAIHTAVRAWADRGSRDVCHAARESREDVDRAWEASLPSFPASDPPAWTSMRARPPTTGDSHPNEEAI